MGCRQRGEDMTSLHNLIDFINYASNIYLQCLFEVGLYRGVYPKEASNFWWNKQRLIQRLFNNKFGLLLFIVMLVLGLWAGFLIQHPIMTDHNGGN